MCAANAYLFYPGYGYITLIMVNDEYVLSNFVEKNEYYIVHVHQKKWSKTACKKIREYMKIYSLFLPKSMLTVIDKTETKSIKYAKMMGFKKIGETEKLEVLLYG